MLFKKKTYARKNFELSTDIYVLIQKQNDAILSLISEVKELSDNVGAYKADKDDEVTAARILDEYLNGAGR